MDGSFLGNRRIIRVSQFGLLRVHLITCCYRAEEENWWTMQAWTMAAGLGCGLLAHVAARVFSRASSSANSKSPLETWTNFPFSTDNKMVLVIRTDLNMGKGKAAAQCAHAAVDLYKKATKRTPKLLTQWESFGQAKVTLKAPEGGEEALKSLQKQAEEKGLVAIIIKDAGHTQIESGSATVLGIGPGPSDIIDKITGHLKLY